MPRPFAEFIAQTDCAGVIIISKKLEIATAIEELILIWVATEANEYVNSIKYLPV
jgi:hypothetical protein